MKNKNIKNKRIGIVEIIVAFLFFIESIWLYTKVSGTNLLFTDSATGKIAAYYWVFLLIGLIVGILGIITIRKKVSIEDSKQLENNKEESSESEKVKKIEHIRIEQKADIIPII